MNQKSLRFTLCIATCLLLWIQPLHSAIDVIANYTSLSGSITSPGYDGVTAYGENKHYQWIIDVNPTSIVYFSFVNLDLEFALWGCYDTFQIFRGTTRWFKGCQRPRSMKRLLFFGGKFFLNMVTDGIMSRHTGFNLTFTVKEPIARFAMLSNTFFSGTFNIGSWQTVSFANQCGNLCDSTTSCVCFAFRSNFTTNNCILSSLCSGYYPLSGYYSYKQYDVLPNFDLISRTNCPGNQLLSNQSVASAFDCGTLCSSTPGCVGIVYTYDNVTHNCWMKDRCYEWEPSGSFNIYSLQRVMSGYNLTINTNCTGGDILPTGMNKTRDECALACNSTYYCSSFVYEATAQSHQCTLKDACSVFATAMGSHVYTKIELPTTEGPTTTVELTTTIEVTTVRIIGSFTIRCYQNCGPAIDIQQSVIVNIAQDFFNCSTYSWVLVDYYSNTELLTQAVDCTLKTAIVHIPPNTLLDNTLYLLTFTAMLGEGLGNHTIRHQFSTNKTGELCAVSPNPGEALKKIHRITCDEPVIPINDTFKYEVRVKGYYKEPLLLIKSPTRVTETVALPLGDPDIYFTTELGVTTINSIGFFVNVVIIAQVQPSSISIINQISLTNSLISSGINNVADAINMVLHVESLDYAEEKLGSSLVQSTMVQARTILCVGLESLPSHNLDNFYEFEQALDVYHNVLARPSKLTIENQKALVNGFYKMSVFTSANFGTMTKFQKLKFLPDMLRISLKFYDAAAEIALDSDVVRLQIKELLTKVAQGKDILVVLQNANSNTGEPPMVAKTDNAIVNLGKKNTTDLNNMTVSHGSGNLFTITTSNTASPTECFDTEGTIQEANFYMWDHSAPSVTTPVIDFRVQNCQPSRRKRAVANSAISQIEGELTPKNGDNTYNVSVTSYNGTVVTHGMELSHSGYTSWKAVTVSLFPTENVTFTVYVWFSENQNLSNYIRKFEVTLDYNDIGYEGNYTIFIPADVQQYHNASAIYIGVTGNSSGCNASTDYSTDCDVDTLEYSYQIAEISCLVWNSLNEEWETSLDCQVQPDSTPKKVRFKSNLLGSIGAGIFVGPNTINFANVFDDLGNKIIDNIAVFLTVFLIILLYIPLAVWCFIKDKKDRRKWMMLPLVDNRAGDEYLYEVHVFTGGMQYADTESKVYMYVAGTEGNTGTRLLDDGERKNFRQGEVSSFLLKCPESIGIPITIRISQDSSGKDDKAGWFLSKLVIVDVSRQNWYMFICDRWLAYDEEDGRTERIVNLLSSDDARTNTLLLQNNMVKMLSSDHIWLSVGYRKTRSLFTRLKRLNCCLATLMLTMVASAMWYGTGDDVSVQSALDLGVISITVHQIYTAVMSTLIIAPPLILITVLYSKSASPPIKEKHIDPQNPPSVLENQLPGIKKKSKKLPFWCAYIAHLLVILSVAAGAFFTILYAFEWGKQKSEEWLGCLFMSVFQSILVIQPVKIILVIVLYTFLLKRDIDEVDFVEAMGKMETRMSGIESKDRVEDTEVISEEKIAKLKRRKELDKIVSGLFYELLWGFIFTLLILWTVLGNQDGNVFLQNNFLRSTFTKDIQSIFKREDTWNWLHSTLLPGLYVRHPDNQGIIRNTNDEKFISDFYSMRIGVPRLRQFRVEQSNCSVVSMMSPYVHQCTHSFGDHWNDEANFRPKWMSTINSTELAKLQLSSADEAFIFKPSFKIPTITYWGRLQFYPGDGYVAKLQGTYESSKRMMNELESKEWIDKYTRAIMVEFSVWNPNTELFSFLTFSLEFPQPGGFTYREDIQSVQLYRYTGAGGLMNIVIEFLTLIVAVVITALQISQMIKHGKSYFSQFWNVVTFIALLFFYVAVGVYVWRCILTTQSLDHAMNNRDETISFSLLSLSHTIFITCLGVTGFLLEMRFLYALRYNIWISTLGQTLMNSYGGILSVAFQFMVLVLAFSSMYHLMYGNILYDYHTMVTASTNVTIMSCDFRGYEKYISNSGTFGGFTVILYAFIIGNITFNLLISILNDVLTAMRDDEYVRKDNDVMDHIFQTFKSIFPSRKKAKLQPAPASLVELDNSETEKKNNGELTQIQLNERKSLPPASKYEKKEKALVQELDGNKENRPDKEGDIVQELRNIRETLRKGIKK